MPPEFAHLHVHTEFSILDGACRVRDVVGAARSMGMDSLAITDHGVMYGALSFYMEAGEQGVKPILGCEVYMAPGSREVKDAGYDESPYHLVLLAENNTGYTNLMRIVTRGFTEGFYYKPRVDHEVLAEHSEGLIALSACLKGEVQRLLLSEDPDSARMAVERFLQIFGEESFFLELMDHGIEEQVRVNPMIVRLARDMGVGLVATNDVHYVRREDADAHDHLLCIQTGKIISETNRLRFSNNEFYLKSGEEMAGIFPDFPEAISNTAAVAARCEVEIPMGRVYLPTYGIPEGYSLESYLEMLAAEGVRRHYGENPSGEVTERLRMELEVIEKLGFAGYFLIVWDFVKHAKEQGIRVGPGRGSAAGSLVAYALGITTIDPLKYSLLFERFLNPERIALPDIDIDFSHTRRAEVIEYVSRKYGRDRVSPIVTFSRLKAKAAVKDVGRVKDVPYARMDSLTKLIPDDPNMTIEVALEQSAELREAYGIDPQVREIVDMARSLEGMVRHASVHAAGVVIADNAIDTYSPLSLQQKSGESSNAITTQYDMYDVERLGLLKVDMLGLKTQSLLELALDLIEQRHGIRLDIDELPMDDEATFRLIQNAQTVGTFQLASPGMRALMRDMVPDRFEDIIALIALYRPGPLKNDMHKVYVEQKRGRRAVSFPHPTLQEVLKETYGVIVYQEQVMRIAQVMAGYTGLEADELRKAMGKKKSEIMMAHREKFIQGAVDNGVDPDTARQVFDLMETFGGYGFNKSHSTAYALVSYQSAYLKAHYPEEYMAALMTVYMDNGDRLVEYINECRRMGLKVRPPDINASVSHFTPGDRFVLFGLSAVRNVGSAVVDQIVDCRTGDGPFSDFVEFCERVPSSVTNKKTLESLIKAGAFDSIEPDRNLLLAGYESAVGTAQRRRREREEGQFSLFGGDGDEGGMAEDMRTLAGEYQEVPKRRLLAFEKEMLGVYVSDHPLTEWRDVLEGVSEIELSQISQEMDRSRLTVAGMVSRLEKRYNKDGKPWCTFILEDFSGAIEVIVFFKKYEETADVLADDIVVSVRGRVDLKDTSRKIIADDIKPVRRGSAKPLRLLLTVDANRYTEDVESRVKGILVEHAGQTPVYLRLNGDGDEGATVRLGEFYSVDADADLIAKLKALLGERAVRLFFPEQ